jgi:pseudaminic acid synthase
MRSIAIETCRGRRVIGPEAPVFIVAELSGNHNGDLGRARALVDAAADAGADAIKLQTYTAETMTIDCDNEYFQVGVSKAWAGHTLYSLYEWACTPWEWQPELKERAEARGVPLFSSPFDAAAVDFLEQMHVPMYKVASLEIGDLALLRKIGATRKPVMMSRGMSSPEEIARALDTLKAAGAPGVALLHCVSSYPAVPEEMNLRTIPDLARRFDIVPGLSDHTLGTSVAVASVALGACVIEKHFTLRRADGGPDAAFSLEPEEFAQMVRQVREVSAALGQPSYEPSAKETETKAYRRSLFVVQDINQGDLLTSQNVRVIRPGHGLEPRYLDAVMGKPASSALTRGTPLRPEHVVGFSPEAGA